MSQYHLENLEQGRLCGCQQCLDRDGLELVEVLDERNGVWRSMLVNWFNQRPLLLASPETQESDFEENQNAEE